LFQLDLGREHDDDSGVDNGGDDSDIIQLLNVDHNDDGVSDDEKNDNDDIVRVCLPCAS